MRDDEAFAAYVEARGPHLVRVAHLLCGDLQLAEDLVQGVLSRAMLRWERLSRLDDVDAYLRKAVVNARTSWWRSVTRREVRVAHVPLPPLPQHQDGTEDRRLLVAELRQLPYAQRAVLVLRYFEQLSETETAAVLGCSVGTVKSSASRGLERLRATAALDHELRLSI